MNAIRMTTACLGAVILGGCMQARIEESREIATHITKDESVVILAKPQIEGAGAEDAFMDCIGENLRGGKGDVTVGGTFFLRLFQIGGQMVEIVRRTAVAGDQGDGVDAGRGGDLVVAFLDRFRQGAARLYIGAVGLAGFMQQNRVLGANLRHAGAKREAGLGGGQRVVMLP